MIIPSGYCQINWRFGGEALPLGAEMTMGGQLLSSPPIAAIGLIASAAWNDNLQNYQVTGVTLESVLVKYGPNATGPSAEFTVGNTGGGSGTGAEPMVSALIRKHTADGGHAGKGRMYFPGIPDAMFLQDGSMDPTTLIAFQADVDAFLDDMDAAALKPVVLHGAASPLSTPSVITGLQVDSQCATQRRRNRR